MKVRRLPVDPRTLPLLLAGAAGVAGTGALVSWSLAAYAGLLGGTAFLTLRVLRLEREKRGILERLKEQEDSLRVRSRYHSLGEMVGNVTHQWRQPLGTLGAIMANLQAHLQLKGEVSPEKLSQSIRQSCDILVHLSQTVDTFRAFLKEEGGEDRCFDLAAQAEGVRGMLRGPLREGNIRLEIFVEPGVIVRGNGNEFGHVLSNLLLNAAEVFRERKTPAPRVVIRLWREGEELLLDVSDNGGGVRIAPLEKIFEPCVTSKEGGTGIGLYIARGIVEERLGGSLAVRNGEEGAIFTLRLRPAPEGSLLRWAEEEEVPEARQVARLEEELEALERVEKALRRWAEIFGRAPWGIAVFDGETGTLELMNPAFARMHGRRVEELTGKPVTAVFPSRGPEGILERMEEADAAGYVAYESEHLGKDGSRFPVAVDLTAAGDEEEGGRYYIATVRDITDRKASDELLKLKRFALNQIREGIFLIGPDGDFHYVNDEACRSLGYDREELLAMTVADIDPNVSLDWWRHHWKVIREEKTTLTTSRHRRKDGSLFPIEVSSNYFEYHGREYSLAVSRDITERLETERKRSDERMRLFFERQLVGMAITSPEKGWLKVNRRLEAMLGYSFEELQTMTWAQVTHPEDLAPDLAGFERLLAGEIDSYTVEKRYVRKDGGILHAHLSIGCVRKEDGSVDYLLALIEDITERKRAEEEILEFNATLERKVEERTARLAAKEREYRTLAENLPDFLMRYDREGRRVYANPALTGYYGVAPEALMGTLPEEFPLVSAPDALAAKVRHVLQTGERTELETSDGGEGKRRWWNILYTPEFGDDGEIAGVLSIGHDITAIKEAEMALRELNTNLGRMVAERTEALREALAFSEGIIHAIPDLLFEVDRDGTYLNVWARDEKLLALQREALVGRNLREVLPPEAAEVAFRTMDQVDRDGSSLGNVYKLELPDGERWFELHTTKKEPGGTYLALSRDITERKNAEAAVRELNATLERRVEERTVELQKALEFNEGIVNALPDLLFELDREGRYLNLWAREEKFLARQKELLLGNTVGETLPPEAAETVMAALEEAEKKGISTGRAFRLELPGGERWFELSVSKKAEGRFLILSRDVTQRERAEKELWLLGGALDAIEETVWLFDATDKGRLIYVNDGACRMLGYTREELLETGIMGVDKEFSPGEAETSLETLRRQGSVELERVHTAKNGRRIPVEITSALFRAGEHAYILATARDISERRVAQRAVAESEQRYREIFENSRDALYVLDVTGEGRFLNVDVNPAFERSTGMKREALVGKYTDETVDEATAKAVNAKYRRCVEAGVPTEEEIELELPSGRRIYRSLLMPVREKPGGRVHRIVGVTEDVTEAREARRELALVRTALDQVGEAAFLADGTGRFRYVNEKACRMLGYPREELLEMGVADVDPDWPGDRWPEHWAALKAAGSLTLEGRHRTKEGRIVPVEITANYFEFEGKPYNLGLVRERKPDPSPKRGES